MPKLLEISDIIHMHYSDECQMKKAFSMLKILFPLFRAIVNLCITGILSCLYRKATKS